MPQIANITSEKYYNQFTNGATFGDNLTDYTANLTGGVGERIKAVIQLAIEWYSNSDSYNSWLVEANAITRFSGSFRDDGFAVGHVLDYISGWSSSHTTPVEFNATITAISTDGLTINFTVNSGAVPTGTQDDAGIRASATSSANYLTSLFWRFGLVANDADYSNVSNVSNNNATLFATGIGLDSGAGRNTAPITMSAQGTYRDWYSGGATVAYVGATTYTQTFEVAHEFIITPFYLDGQLSDLQNTVLPDYLQGENTLKYSYQAEFRLVLSNPNTAVVATIDSNLGSVGWFGENFNGLGAAYSLLSIAYTDSNGDTVSALQSFATTTVTATIAKTGSSFSAGQKVGVIIAYLAPESEYQNTTTDIEENFLLESLYHTNGLPAEYGTIIKNLSSVIVGSDLEVSFEIEYTQIQAQRLDGGAYLIGLQVADSTLASSISDRVILLADAQDYISSQDVPDLMGIDSFGLFFGPLQVGVDDGYTEALACNEDSLAMEFEWWLDIGTTKQASINTLSFSLIAYDATTGDSFELDSFAVPIAPIVSGGSQQIAVDMERGYSFASGNQYREISIETGSLIGNKQYYTAVISQKIRWEDWLSNLNVDPAFYDATEPNSNLNFKASNYSDLLNYEIRLAVNANISGLNAAGLDSTTDYRFITPNIPVSDYGVSPEWTCTIETFRQSSGANLGGAILSGEDTLVKSTFNAASGAIASLTGYFAIIRIQPANDAGQTIEELSTYYGTAGTLKPKPAFSYVDMYLSAGDVVAECLVDGSFIEQGNTYQLSARLESAIPDPPLLFMNNDGVLFMNGDQALLMAQ